jgi:acetyltransferase-like isoleucine patch superfamily enzyme
MAPKLVAGLVRDGKQLVFGTLVRREAKSVGRDLRVNYYSRVTASTVLGDNVNFNGMTITGRGDVRIGNNFHSGSDCMLIAENHNYDSGTAIPYDDTYVVLPITIEDNVWLGNRVIILGGVTVGEGAIIQAGSCVVSDIPRCAIAGGHPAKVFRERDIEHYEKLKAEGRFH